jgi:TRAP-type mannitol/chloroaromatic compound transport system permease large subunit
MTLLLFGVFLVLLFLGVPVAFSIGISSLAYVLFTDIPLVIIPQKMYAALMSSSYCACRVSF